MLAHSLFIGLGLLCAATAAPAPGQLSPDDVIVLKNDGTSQIMKASEFDALDSAKPAPASNGTAPLMARRGCEESTEVQVTSDEEFLNWDVALSPVLSSVGGQGTVSVTSGYSISNSVSVTATVSLSGIEKILGLSLSVQYSQSWTSSESQTLSFAVPDGKHGVIVSQPYVRRVQGNILEGCTDDWKKTPFVSDTYTSQSYGNLQWVKGVIRLCSSDTYPIPFCNGEGKHT